MFKHIRPLLLLAVLLTAFAATGCGAASQKAAVSASDPSSTADTSKVVVRVGSSTIRQATLRHWMTTFVISDYFEHLNRKPPSGLVSEPLNIPACVVAARKGTSEYATHAHPTQTQLKTLCKQLYYAVRQQALSFLISNTWRAEEARAQGGPVTQSEVAQKFKQVQATQFSAHGELDAYLRQRGLTLADEMYQMKLLLLSEKFVKRLQIHIGEAAGGEQAVVKAAAENAKSWTAKTSCIAGYMVPECSGYRASAVSAPPAPATLLEKIVSGS